MVGLGFTGNFVGIVRYAYAERINSNFRARVLVEQFNRVAQTAGGGVVPVTESSGQDENFFHGR